MGYDKYVKDKDLLRCPEQISTDQPEPKQDGTRDWNDQTSSRRSKLITSHLAEISEATEQDTDLQFVIHHTSICWTLYKRNVPVEILPYWSVKYELSFSDEIVYRNDRILVLAALHAKDPDNQLKLRIWAKVQPLGVPEHHYGDQRWTSNWCSSLIHVKSATLSRLRTKLQTQVKSWVWYFWVDQGTLSGYSWLLCTCHCLAPGVEPGPGKARECVGESFSTFMKSTDFSQQIAETARKRAQHSNQL